MLETHRFEPLVVHDNPALAIFEEVPEVFDCGMDDKERMFKAAINPYFQVE